MTGTSRGAPDDCAAPGWARRTAGGWQLALTVQPGARHTRVVGPHGETLKVRVAAPADAGRANRALCEFLARELSVPVHAVSVVRGRSGRTKAIAVEADVDVSVLDG
jgi:uncharacterized protein (TIGR00251 family)